MYKKEQKTWTKYDVDYLVNNYGILKTKQIAINLNRSYISVKSMATKRLKLDYGGKYKNNLLPLLEDLIENWYWLGFIVADGHLNDKYLTITTHPEDESHLIMLANKLNNNINTNNKGYKVLSVSDCNNIQALKSKIGQYHNIKTYNPLNINYNISSDLYFSFLIGFIDGDGCIEIRNGKAAQLKIELHSSWYKNLVIISNFLKEYLNVTSTTIINKRGYSLFRISGHKNILKIKNKALALNISYLNRKWDNISDNTTGCNFYKELEPDVLKLYKEGNNLYKISKILNINYNSLFNHKKEIIDKCK